MVGNFVSISNKRVFLFTGTSLAVYRQEGKCLVRPYVFRHSRVGLQEFVNYLDEDPWTPVRFLVDFMEEEFRIETIPHVFGSDKRALLANRQRRLFRNTPYRHTVFQGRETGGRRDDTVLFAAVIHPEALQPWLDPIAERRIPLVGICSLPIWSKRLLSRLQANSASGVSDYVLLVHRNADGGLRQSFFYRQHLKVSRLAAMPRFEKADDAVWDYILGEVENIRRYLNGLRLLPGDEVLEIYFLGNTKMLTYLERKTIDSRNMRSHFVDMEEMDVGIEIPEELRMPCADPLFAGMLIRAIPVNHYAPPRDVRYFRSAQIRKGMYGSGLALLAAGMIGGMFQLSEGLIIEQRTTMLAKQAGIYAERYEDAKVNLPEIPADGPALKAAVETAIGLRESKTTPYGMLLVLSKVLDQERGLEIEEIEWLVSTDPNTPIGASGISRDSSGTSIESSPGSFLARTDKMTMGRYRIGLIRGRIAAFDGDYRRAILLVERFAKRLSRHDAIEDVRIIQRPLNIDSDEALMGKAGAAPGSADFALRIVVRGEPS